MLPTNDRCIDELVAEHDQAPLRREELRAAGERVRAGQDMRAIEQEAGTMTSAREQPRHRPPGETTGSLERPAQRVAAPRQGFDLTAELGLLRQERSWLQGDRDSKTLIKQPTLRVVLTALRAGARLATHQAAGPTTVQVLHGLLRVRVAEQAIELRPGQLLALEARVRHDVVAVEDSAFLLTVAWPTEES
jgi:quercetin dioxygenase-like cupin family protein